MRTFLIRAAAATALALPLTGAIGTAASASTPADHAAAQVQPVAASHSAKTKPLKSGSEEPRDEDSSEASKVAVGGGLLAIGGAGIVYAMRRNN